MTSLIFEGEFQELSPKQNQFIRDVLEKRGFKNNKVVFEPVGKVGDNYVANVKRITVKNENDNNFYMIAKIAPKIQMLREVMNAEILFKNEIVMYTEVFPKFMELQENADVAEDDKLCYPECYGYFEEVPDEIILLQDLKPNGFEMFDRLKPLPSDAVKIVLKNIAKLHSLSYVLKKLSPDTYTTLKTKLIDVYNMDSRPEDNEFFTILETSFLEVLDDDKYKDQIRGAITRFATISKKLIKRDANSKYSIIQQGDVWTNNVLFKLEDATAKNCIMIDYQIAREANPVCDILYMIFNCTDYNGRDKHFYEWLNYYHEQLDQLLHYYGMKANYIYPKDQLDADIRRYSKTFFGISLIVFSALLRKTEEVNVIKEDDDISKMIDSMKISALSSETVVLFKTRAMELIDSCKELGLF